VPGAGSKSCYVWASAAGPLRFSVTREPSHGTIGLAPGADGLHALATYMPVAGYSGPDSFSYVATDARGLTSPPATARVRVPAAPAAALVVAPARARLSKVRVVKRRGRWRVELRVSAPARLSGRLERRRDGRKTTFRLRSRRVGAGPARMALGRLTRGRYRLRVLVDGKTGATARFRVRRF